MFFSPSFNPAAFAGGGPENVFLIVNSADMNSQVIANHYAEWRKIPEVCRFQIFWPNAPQRTDVNVFRKRILKPIMAELEKRKLTKQIDYIVYSSGFPYAVNFADDLRDPNEKYPIASLTSLTYLYEDVLEGSAKYRMDLSGIRKTRMNSYARSSIKDVDDDRSRGFDAQTGIGPDGERVEGGPRYYLSMMLGYTRGKASNSVSEILRYLLRGVQADGTKPEGTIYFVKNGDVRSTTRAPAFEEVAAKIQAEGVSTEIVEGADDPVNCLPVKKPNVMGAMIGKAVFNWRESKSQILPGAICENLTSTGGVLAGSSQTLLCELLRFGATASSGTVVEPFSIQAKFPHPLIHLHYVRGCSIAESFYQSVVTPFQLIMVGDPLCQPWAEAPKVVLSGLDAKKPVSGIVQFSAKATSKSGSAIRKLELYVDGRLAGAVKPEDPIVCDSSKLPDGYHELRVVAVEDTDIETQGRVITSFVTANNGKSSRLPTVTMIPKSGKLGPGGRGFVKVSYPNAKEVRLYRGRTLIGRSSSSSGQIRVTADRLGGGLAILTPVAIPKKSGAKVVFGAPLEVRVKLGLDK